MGNNQLYPILLNLLAALLGAGGQYFYKNGALKLKVAPLWQNWQILLGACLFTMVMVLFVQSFKLGGKLSVVYPVYATTFIWGVVFGIYFENEPWNYYQLLGLILIILGVTVLTLFAPQSL
jgi:multidrug transporter EmrE-like cation transporter